MSTMHNDSSRSFWSLWPRYLACYALWIVFSAVGLWIMFQVRVNVNDLVVLFRLGPWVLGLMDKVAILVMGIVWLVAMLVMENYLREGVVRGLLLKRSLRIFLAEAIMSAASVGLQLLLV